MTAAPALSFVLIHGGAVTGRLWDRLLPHQRRPAVAVDLPGRAGKSFDPMTITVDDCVRSVVADVKAATDGDIILVAHSSGGLVVPGVARALGERVRHIVLSAASVPPEGGLGLECMKPSHRASIEKAMSWARANDQVLTTPGPPDDPEVLRSSYGDVLSDEELQFITDPSRFVHDTMNLYFQPISWRGVAGVVPVTYVKNMRDRPVPPALQDEMAGHIDAHIIELDCGHVPAVTMPARLAEVLEEIATEATGARR